MMRVDGELRRIGSWSGQSGSDGGRLEFMDIGDRHIRRIGCTSYLQGVLSTSMGQHCSVAFSAPFGGKLGHEILGIRLADGSCRMAGTARLIKLVLGLVLVLPIAGVLLIGLPLLLLLAGLQSLLPFLGGLLMYIGILGIVAFVLFCLYSAVRVPIDYARAKAALSLPA